MVLPQRQVVMTTEEFIAWEDQQPDKHEFVAGEVFAMGGARRIHVAATGNCFAKLKEHLRGGPCRAFMADMKLEVKTAEAVFYPDVLVTCHPDDLKADLAMRHPKVIIEVLSRNAPENTATRRSPPEGAEKRLGRPGVFLGTAAYDRGDKFAAYRQLESLQEYALIDPDARRVEVFRRMESGDWLLMASESDKGLILKSLDFAAGLEAVFEDI